MRPRAYVGVRGPDAADLLQRVVSNDVSEGEACEALLLTPKGRVIAPLVVWRRGEDDFLLLTEPELGATVRDQLTPRADRLALRDRAGGAHLGDRLRRTAPGIPTRDYGVPAVEVLDAGVEAAPPDERAGATADPGAHTALGPRDRRGDPAGRGWARRARGLVHERLLSGAGAARPTPQSRARQSHAARARARRRARASDRRGAVRGRRRRPGHERSSRDLRSPTSASRCRKAPRSRSKAARRGYTDPPPAPVAQGIERCPAEAEVASSNLAGRIRAVGSTEARGAEVPALPAPEREMAWGSTSGSPPRALSPTHGTRL